MLWCRGHVLSKSITHMMIQKTECGLLVATLIFFVSLQPILSLSGGYAPARMTLPLSGQCVMHGYVVCHPEMPSLTYFFIIKLLAGNIGQSSKYEVEYPPGRRETPEPDT